MFKITRCTIKWTKYTNMDDFFQGNTSLANSKWRIWRNSLYLLQRPTEPWTEELTDVTTNRIPLWHV